MSIIGIKSIPMKCGLSVAVEMFSKSIGGPFDALNFIPKGNHKTFYIRLSETLDPVQVVHRINTNPRFLTKKLNEPKYVAFVAKQVPDIFAVNTKKKKNKKKKYDTQKLEPAHEDIEQPYSTQPNFQPSQSFNCNTLVQYPVPGLYQPMPSNAMSYAPQSAGQTVQNPFMPFGNPNEMSSQDTSSFSQNDYSGWNNPKPQDSSRFGQNDYSGWNNTKPEDASSFGQNNNSRWDNPNPQDTRPKFKQGPSTSGNNTRNWSDQRKPFARPAFDHLDDYDNKFEKPNAKQKSKGFSPDQMKKRMFNVCFSRSVNKIMIKNSAQIKKLNLDMDAKVLGKEYVSGVKKLMKREIMDRVYKLLGDDELITENDVLKRYRNLFSEDQDIQMYKNTRELVDSAINSGNPSAWAQIMRPQDEIDEMNNMTKRKIKKVKEREEKFQKDLLKISRCRPQPQGEQ